MLAGAEARFVAANFWALVALLGVMVGPPLEDLTKQPNETDWLKLMDAGSTPPNQPK